MKAIKVLIVLTLFLSLTGCWDKKEVEELAYVVVLGIDIGKDNLLEVTYQIANPQVGSSDRVQVKEPPSDTITVLASDIISAKELANSSITRKLTFAHLQAVIISEDMARTEQLERVLSSSIRDREIRRETNIIISKEKASEFIRNNKPKMETRPHKYYFFMQRRWQDTGLVPYSTYNKFFERIENDSLYLAIYATSQENPTKKKGYEDDYVAGQIPKIGGDPVQAIGSAVINHKMIGTLTGEETRLALLLREKSKANRWLSTYVDPLDKKFRVATRLIHDKNTKIKMDCATDRPIIQVRVPITLQLLNIASGKDYVTNAKNQKLLKKSIETSLENKSNELIKRSQEVYKGEFFKWYLEARRCFLTNKEYQNYNFKEKYPNAKIDITFDVRIESFGKQLSPAKTK